VKTTAKSPFSFGAPQLNSAAAAAQLVRDL
jgi:hypothetical protein